MQKFQTCSDVSPLRSLLPTGRHGKQQEVRGAGGGAGERVLTHKKAKQ